MANDRRAYHKAYYWRHKPHLAAIKADRQKHDLDYRLRAVLRTIVQRCDDPRHTSYKWYGGKGIKNFLTFEDVRVLWLRDGAREMKRPSIDRIDSADDYTFDNCQFIEHAENVRKARKKAA
jgi:hypothetical protein